MNKGQSNLTETSARDALHNFLLSCNRKPLKIFLKFFLGDNYRTSFPDLENLELPTEDSAHTFQTGGKTSLTARTDLVIKNNQHLLAVEIKVNAEESLHQYDKYQAAYEERGYKTKVVGLINRIKTQARIKDHEPFLKKYKRVLWSELVEEFERHMKQAPEFIDFKNELKALDSNIAIPKRPLTASIPTKSVDLLGEKTAALHEFYEDFARLLPNFKVKPFQAGSTGYELHLGKSEWAQAFQEPLIYRISLALNPHSRQIERLHQEPYFAFCVLLWHRSNFKNLDSFLKHGPILAKHLHRCGFEIVRNKQGWKNGNTSWEPPFIPDSKMCFANAFWEKRFSLPRSQYVEMSWTELLQILKNEFQKLVLMMDKAAKTIVK